MCRRYHQIKPRNYITGCCSSDFLLIIKKKHTLSYTWNMTTQHFYINCRKYLMNKWFFSHLYTCPTLLFYFSPFFSPTCSHPSLLTFPLSFISSFCCCFLSPFYTYFNSLHVIQNCIKSFSWARRHSTLLTLPLNDHNFNTSIVLLPQRWGDSC